MTRHAFALATAEDDAALRARMAADPIAADIAVTFRREPSYFAACRLLGAESQVVKCTDRVTGEIVGMGARHVTRAYVNGRPQAVAYLSDLRGAPAARRGMLLARGYRYLRDLEAARPLAHCYTVIFADNAVALATLVGARAGLPEYRDRGRIRAAAIQLDVPRKRLAVPGVELRPATAADLEPLVAFLNREHARKHYATAWTARDIDGGFGTSLRLGDFSLAIKSGEIVAAVAAWDQSALRQTFIEGYSRRFALLRLACNALARISPLKPLPSPGERLPFFYLSAIAVREDDPRLFAALLRHVYNERRRGPWSCCVASLHQDDPLCEALAGYRAIASDGRLFSVHWTAGGEPLDGRIPYVDLARA